MSLSLLNKDLSSFPVEELKGATSIYGARNRFSDLSQLDACADTLETLILDHNGLTTALLASLPRLPKLHTLWLNNNSITDLPQAIGILIETVPQLTNLSLMSNPAAPPLVALSAADAAAAARYRLGVIYQLPSLVFLDGTPVSPEERAEAKAKGASALPRAAHGAWSALRGQTQSDSRRRSAAALVGTSTAASSAASAGAARADESGAYLAIATGRYEGTASEGNRYIVDSDL